MKLQAPTARTVPDARSRAGLHAHLEARRTEIEAEALARIRAISDPGESADPGYLEGLRAAVSAAIEYGLGTLEGEGERPPPVPVPLLAQARLAARNGVSLDTVLRRYFAGYRIFTDLLLSRGTGGESLDSGELKRLLGALAVRFDRLIAAVSEEFRREAGARPETSEQRRAELVECLLAGEFLDHAPLAAELSYEFECHHLGLLAAGPGAGEAVAEVATALDCRLLAVPRGDGVLWAWLGARRRLDPAELELPPPAARRPGLALAIGEPGEGPAGWRLTHRQAAAALPIARRGAGGVVRYADVALIASIHRDDLLATSLRRLYLLPLESERDGGETARETLRAYFAAGRNVSSAAAALRLNRHTVASRLRAIADRLGSPFGSRDADLEIALRFDEFDRRALPGRRKSDG